MTAQPHEHLTQADFPAWELRQEAKHEFAGGHVHRFAGGTIEHNALAAQLLAAIVAHLRGGPCRTYGPDMLIEMATSTRYADVVVTCDDRDRIRGATVIRYPKLIVEVLSDSTAATDLGNKMREYQGISELEEYVAVDSRKRWIQVIRKRLEDWIITVVSPADPSPTLELKSIGLDVKVDDLYALAGIP